jgi:16S rRNA (cytidine1402-2'-O)-methyltransferase
MLTLVPTPIGNIADISLRAMDALRDAEILLCEDTRVTKKLLHILHERYNLERKEQEFISLHSHNEQDDKTKDQKKNYVKIKKKRKRQKKKKTT